MSKDLIEDLQQLIAGWNKLGDEYYKEQKEEPDRSIKLIFREKSNVYYKCAESLREKLLKHGTFK
jgi:hypothetical protein